MYIDLHDTLTHNNLHDACQLIMLIHATLKDVEITRHFHILDLNIYLDNNNTTTTILLIKHTDY